MSPLVISALLVVLSWTAIVLTALAWFGIARQRLQCHGLAARFQAELRRRGLFSTSVVRT
jgi:hypothetical protein